MGGWPDVSLGAGVGGGMGSEPSLTWSWRLLAGHKPASCVQVRDRAPPPAHLCVCVCVCPFLALVTEWKQLVAAHLLWLAQRPPDLPQG